MLRSLFPTRAAPVERLVQIYCSGTRFIVAAMHQVPGGVYYEQAAPVVLEVREPAELGLAFRAAFDAFSLREREVPGRDGKKSDWPAYRASGLPSMKAFEREYTTLQCAALNPSNAVVRASRVSPADPAMELSITFNPRSRPEEIGAALLRLARAGAA